MSRFVTPALLLLIAAWCGPALAQPNRVGTDIVWARDVGGATFTLDGQLDEPQWDDAEVVVVRWENPTFYRPGGGWDDFFASFPEVNNTDPVQGTIRYLRKGNQLWLGVAANDASVGGGRDFFRHDGVVMSITDKRNRTGPPYTEPNNFNGANTDEFFYSWLNFADTTATGDPLPGVGPTYFGNEADDRALWEAATVVDGLSNDDSGGDDNGYTMEIRMDMSILGFNMNDADGDRLPMSIGLYDFDYAWPADANRQFLGRAWFQNPWGGDMPHGVNFVYGSPDVTTNSGAVPSISRPEVRLLKASGGAITLDGQLDEAAWQAVDPQVNLQYQPSLALLNSLPGFGPYYTHWFRPGGDLPDAPPVVDPTIGRIRMFYDDGSDVLYVGLDTDDQAISGQSNEERTDGLRVIVRSRTSEGDLEGRPYLFRGYRAYVDSSGAAVLLTEPSGEPGFDGDVFLKGSSTAADPNDIDEGYQLEMAIDLNTIPGYESGLGDRIIWIGAAYFDGDDLPDPTQSYGMRTWWLVERGGGPFGGPAAHTYLDPNVSVATEGGPGEVPTAIRLDGGFPNPFDASTTLRYALPASGEVTVLVYDALGREVARIAPGLQAAGANAVTLDAAGLASGVYVYRVRLDGARGAEVSPAAQVTLLK